MSSISPSLSNSHSPKEAVFPHDACNPPPAASNFASAYSKMQEDRKLTQLLNTAVGDMFRATLKDKSILVYARVVDDGIGDLVHLVNTESHISKDFGASVQFFSFADSDDSLARHQEIIRDANSQIQEIDLDVNALYNQKKPPASLTKDLKPIETQVCISHELVDKDVLPCGDKPTIIIEEITMPEPEDRNNPHQLRMGLGTENVGIWLSDSPNPEQALASASEKLKKMLGCEYLTGEALKKWHEESVICTTMLYREEDDAQGVLATLAMIPHQNPNAKRVILKTRQSPLASPSSVYCYPQNYTPEGLSHRMIKGFQQLKVQRIILNGTTIFEKDQEGLEITWLTSSLDKEDWDVFKQIINGIYCVGGDNTLSEALSNPNTLPPLIFSQHSFKESAYFKIIKLTKDLPNCLEGKAGLINYLKKSNEYAYNFRNPVKYANKIAEILAKTGYKIMQEAWAALVLHARNSMNLSDFISSLITERIFLTRFPEMLEARALILAQEGSIEEKSKIYIDLANKKIGGDLEDKER